MLRPLRNTLGALLLLLSACTTPKQESHPTAMEQGIMQEDTIESTDTCSGITYSLYKEGVELWASGWLSAHGTDEAISIPIDIDLLSGLRSVDESAASLRAYYFLNEGDTIPGLVWVNITNCIDQTNAGTDDVLVCPYNAPGYLINSQDVAPLTEAWRNRVDNLSDQVYTPVYAYNYSWEVISNLISTSTDGNIYVTYGLRTIAPDEDEYEPNSDADFGSVVYVNILSDAIERDDATAFDFTYPCPKHCDTSSVLMNYTD